MIKRLCFLLLILLAAGCSSARPAVDWCYKFDFTSSNYSFTVLYGTWTSGAGFSPDGQGRFDISYTHTSTVHPDDVVFDVLRGDTNQLPIKVGGKVEIFGMDSGTLETTVPPDVGLAELVLRQQGNGSDKLAIVGEATRTIILTAIQVRGFGSNPFPSSNCTTDAVGDVGVPIQLPNITGIINDANQQLADAGDSLTAPDGSPLLPAETGATLFGYAKWITSPAAADELLGPFAPAASHVGIFLTMDIALVALYAIIYGAVSIARWVIWLFRLLLQIIQAIASAANGVLGWILGFIGL